MSLSKSTSISLTLAMILLTSSLLDSYLAMILSADNTAGVPNTGIIATNFLQPFIVLGSFSSFFLIVLISSFTYLPASPALSSLLSSSKVLTQSLPVLTISEPNFLRLSESVIPFVISLHLLIVWSSSLVTSTLPLSSTVLPALISASSFFLILRFPIISFNN